MSIIYTLLFLFVVLVDSQRVARYYDDEVVRGDEFIDNLLQDMLYEHGHEFDPYRFEDSVVTFSKKVAFINVTGEAKLHNGYMIGLKSLHRPDHSSLREENDRLYVTADLGAGILDLHYDGTVKFMNWGPTISVYGQLMYLETHMEFSVDAKTGKEGVLEKFAIDDMKGMKVWITGLGPLNWAVNYIISGVTSLFKGFIRNMIVKQVRNHLDERLPNYTFPVDTSMEVTETTGTDTTVVIDITGLTEEGSIFADKFSF